MSQELERELREQRALLESIHKSVEQTRQYFLWTLIITVVLFILPLLGLAFAIPSFMNTYQQYDQLLSV
jgi:hypothetical protein